MELLWFSYLTHQLVSVLPSVDWLRGIDSSWSGFCAICAWVSGHGLGWPGLGAGAAAAAGGAGPAFGPDSDANGDGVTGRELWEHEAKGVALEAGPETVGRGIGTPAAEVAGKSIGLVAGTAFTAFSAAEQMYKGAKAIKDSRGVYGGANPSAQEILKKSDYPDNP